MSESSSSVGVKPALHRLSAAVVIATYNRPDDIFTCLKFISRQSRMPEQVIVVDGSPEAERTRQRIDESLPELKERTRFEFIAGPRGLPVQLNMGLDRARTDVSIIFDDDSFPEVDYIDCIMRVYEADSQGIVGGVEGTAIEGAAAYQAVAAIEGRGGATGGRGAGPASPSMLRRINAARKRVIFLWMIRYIGPFFPKQYLPPAHEVKLPAEAGAGEALSHLYGCVMSYRTPIIQKYRFCELFKENLFMNDFEVSYRIGRDYALVKCPEARAYHLQSSGGRADMSKRRFGYLMNLGYIARTCMPWSAAVRAHMIRHHRHYTQTRFINIFLERSGWASWCGAKLANREARALFDAADGDVGRIYLEAGRRARERNYR